MHQHQSCPSPSGDTACQRWRRQFVNMLVVRDRYGDSSYRDVHYILAWDGFTVKCGRNYWRRKEAFVQTDDDRRAEAQDDTIASFDVIPTTSHITDKCVSQKTSGNPFQKHDGVVVHVEFVDRRDCWTRRAIFECPFKQRSTRQPQTTPYGIWSRAHQREVFALIYSRDKTVFVETLWVPTVVLSRVNRKLCRSSQDYIRGWALHRACIILDRPTQCRGTQMSFNAVCTLTGGCGEWHKLDNRMSSLSVLNATSRIGRQSRWQGLQKLFTTVAFYISNVYASGLVVCAMCVTNNNRRHDIPALRTSHSQPYDALCPTTNSTSLSSHVVSFVYDKIERNITTTLYQWGTITRYIRV